METITEFQIEYTDQFLFLQGDWKDPLPLVLHTERLPATGSFGNRSPVDCLPISCCRVGVVGFTGLCSLEVGRCSYFSRGEVEEDSRGDVGWR